MSDLVERLNTAADILDKHPCEVYEGAKLYREAANKIDFFKGYRNGATETNVEQQKLLTKAQAERDTALQNLGNLMAVIFRDGGQRQTELGGEAPQKAEDEVVALRVERDDYNELTEQNRAALARVAELEKQFTFNELLTLCQRAHGIWRCKPHNKKWSKKLDGTPILNDLMVNVAETITRAALTPKEAPTINVQDPDHLQASLDHFGPSEDGSVERDLAEAKRRKEAGDGRM